VLELTATGPFDGRAVLAYLAARTVAGVEEVRDDTYVRSLRLDHGGATVTLTPGRSAVHAEIELDDERDHDDAVARCRALLDLDRDPRPVHAALAGDPVIGRLVAAAPGRRVPGAADGTELAVRAVLGQQVSLAGAATAAARLTAAYGQPLRRPVGTVTHLFPSAEAFAGADPATLRMPGARARSLIGLATALAEGALTLTPAADRAATRGALLALPGIGPWTAEYIAMRALHDPDAFPASDLGIRRALERRGLDGRSPAATRLAEAWRPYRAYAVVHLWASLAA
jgi:AraC family transcriptional regulator of adaptative response / DNA-3-methyladenine glycosylase II